MPKVEYEWEIGHPATLEPHSLAKHTILRRYIEDYIRILTANRLVPELSLVLIDGFAGGGEYVLRGETEIRPGSPFILIDAVKAGTLEANKDRKKPVIINASFIFVEKKRANFIYLQNALKQKLSEQERQRVSTVHGAFEDHLDAILDSIRSTKGRKLRPIFVLDQYGYSHVPLDMIKKIMKSSGAAEIFLTMAFDSIRAYASDVQDQMRKIERALGITLQQRRILEDEHAVDLIAESPADDKARMMRFVQQFLHDIFAKQSGALCYTPFFITSKKSRRSYWFLHLAHNARANDAVKSLHWREQNHFSHYGEDGLMMLGVDQSRPPSNTQLAFDFDPPARERTINSLLRELPERIQAEFKDGISVKDLYAGVMNETPASMEILRDAVDEGCRRLELKKRGADGEERDINTKIKDDDVITIPDQQAFSFIKRT